MGKLRIITADNGYRLFLRSPRYIVSIRLPLPLWPSTWRYWLGVPGASIWARRRAPWLQVFRTPSDA